MDFITRPLARLFLLLYHFRRNDNNHKNAFSMHIKYKFCSYRLSVWAFVVFIINVIELILYWKENDAIFAWANMEIDRFLN